METEGEMARQYIAKVVFIYEGISAISDVLRMHKDRKSVQEFWQHRGLMTRETQRHCWEVGEG